MLRRIAPVLVAPVLVALVLAALFCPRAALARQELVAVLELRGTGVEEEMRALLTDQARGEAVRVLKGRFSVLTRANQEAVLGSQGIDLSKCDADACDVDILRQISARYGVTGSVIRLSTTLRLNLTLYDVKSGVAVDTVSRKLSGEPATLLDRAFDEVGAATRALLERNLARPAAAVAARARRGQQAAAYDIPVGDSPVLGSRNAKVHLVIFTDFQCPFCARVDPLLYEVVEDPELRGKVNVVFKHFPLPFHSRAIHAAKAAMAAREQGEAFFWRFSQELYANQRELTDENFLAWAREIGLDVQRFRRDLRKHDARYERIIKADTKLGTRGARVRGTPSLFVNGWELRNRSVEGVKALIREKGLL